MSRIYGGEHADLAEDSFCVRVMVEGVGDWRSAISAQPRTIDFSPLASERFSAEQF